MTLVVPPIITINLYFSIIVFMLIFSFGFILGQIFTLLQFPDSDSEKEKAAKSQDQEESNEENQQEFENQEDTTTTDRR